MTYDEFVRWAQEYIVTEFLETGISGIKRGLHTVTQQAALNHVWGGQRKKP